MTESGEPLLTIGQLARRSGLTTKALRHYHRLGLLAPDEVDPTQGYRYYAAATVRTARMIATLRGLDLPLEEVRACLAAATPSGFGQGTSNSGLADQKLPEIEQILLRHRRRLEARSTRIRGDLHRLDHLLTDGELLMALTEPPTPATPTDLGDERRLAANLFNEVWSLLEQEDRSRADDDRMLHMAHASRHHWAAVGTEVNLARGEWQCSRVYAVLGRAEPALHHAQRVLDLCQENGIGDFDLAFAYEAIARARAVAGDAAGARAATEQALVAAVDIADDEDRELVLADLETIPGQPRFW